MDPGTVLMLVRRRLWLVAGLAVLAGLGAGIAIAANHDEHRQTVNFVLHPAASYPRRDVPSAVDVLRADGPLVQTVLGVLDSDEMVRRAAREVDIDDSADYQLASTLRPGSNIIDATITGPDAQAVSQLGRGLVVAAAAYVTAAYPGFEIDRLGIAAGDGGGADPIEVILVAMLLGAALGVVLVVVESRFQTRAAVVRSLLDPVDVASPPSPRRRPSLSPSTPPGRCPRASRTLKARASPSPSNVQGPSTSQRPSPRPEPGTVADNEHAAGARADAVTEPGPGRCRGLTAKGTRCRRRAVDDRGFCRIHLPQARSDVAVEKNGDGGDAAEPSRLTDALRHSPGHAPRRRVTEPPTPTGRDDDG